MTELLPAQAFRRRGQFTEQGAFSLAATWRKQPSIADRYRHSPPKSFADHTCRRCDTVIPDGLHYCPVHYAQLSDIQKDNLRRVYHE